MSNKKYRIIFDILEYIDGRLVEFIDDISNLQTSSRHVNANNCQWFSMDIQAKNAKLKISQI